MTPAAHPAPATAAPLRLRVNGTPRTAPAGTTLADLLAELDVPVRHAAVERNRELVPRTRHADCRLADGDELEIVTLVGGG